MCFALAVIADYYIFTSPNILVVPELQRHLRQHPFQYHPTENSSNVTEHYSVSRIMCNLCICKN